jgi:hypothetical protein
MAIYSGFTHWKWWFSIVMLVYQRVWSATCALSFPVGHTQAQVAIGDDRGRVDWVNHKHGIVKNINWDFGVQLLWRFTSFTLCITPLNAHIWNNIYIYTYQVPHTAHIYIYIIIYLSIYIYICLLPNAPAEVNKRHRAELHSLLVKLKGMHGLHFIRCFRPNKDGLARGVAADWSFRSNNYVE